MKVRLLGTGTSNGVPVIGCSCPVCTSSNPHDRRLRTSALVTVEGKNILIDAGPDLRQQMLEGRVSELAAVLLTHEHNDHVIGLDDLRPFIFQTKIPMPIYAAKRVLAEVRSRFAYAFLENPYPGSPKVEMIEIEDGHDFFVQNIRVRPIEVMHGSLPVTGFRLGDFTYITDAKTISQSELEKIRGSKVLVLNTLNHKGHSSHLSLDEALAIIKELAPERAYLTHISHQLGLAAEINPRLPRGVQLGWDGLEFEV